MKPPSASFLTLTSPFPDVLHIRCRRSRLLFRRSERRLCRRNSSLGFGAAPGIEDRRTERLQRGRSPSLIDRVTHLETNAPEISGDRRDHEAVLHARPSLLLHGDPHWSTLCRRDVDSNRLGQKPVNKTERDDCRDRDDESFFRTSAFMITPDSRRANAVICHELTRIFTN